MLAKVAGANGIEPAAVPAWRFLLNGLWWSGLRLAEALALQWDSDNGLSVDLTGRRPMMRIPAALEKGNQDRLLPMAPEFAELLATVPQDQRTGKVFALPGNPRTDAVSKIICGIGQDAGVRVRSKQDAPAASDKPRRKGVRSANRSTIKFASAHDLRRSFGERWASRIMPQL